MGYNIYSQIGKVQESLKQKGYVKDIPVSVFGSELMLIFGMTQKRASYWIKNFETVGLIRRNNGSVDFVKQKKV